MEIRWQIGNDDFCRKILKKHWPKVKRYGDIKEVSGSELEPVELICGGFPCQPVSCAGRRKAQEDERWLWPEFARIVCYLRPRLVLVENVPGLLTASQGRAAQEVFGDLAALGYDADWECIPAAAFGTPHLRYRTFVIAHLGGAGWAAERSEQTGVKDCAGSLPEPVRSSTVFANPDFAGLAQRQEQVMLAELQAAKRSTTPADPDGEPLVRAAIARGERHAWTVEPGVVRTFHGISPWVDGHWSDGWGTGVPPLLRGTRNRKERIAALGNAVVPQAAEWLGRRILEVL